jgi:hypothetical protein
MSLSDVSGSGMHVPPPILARSIGARHHALNQSALKLILRRPGSVGSRRAVPTFVATGLTVFSDWRTHSRTICRAFEVWAGQESNLRPWD